MSNRARLVRRVLCFVAYLLPLLVGILFPIYAARPHVWYIRTEGVNITVHETVNLPTLRENAQEACDALLDGAAGTDTAMQTAAYALKAFLIAATVSSVLFYFTVSFTAVCTLVAFCLPPTHRYANFAKRLLRFFCPNRICFLLSFLWALVPALLPHALLFCYKHLMGLTIRVHFDPMADWILVLIGIVLCAAVYIVTLPWQAEEHLDMFRIYKSKSAVPRAGDEVI